MRLWETCPPVRDKVARPVLIAALRVRKLPNPSGRDRSPSPESVVARSVHAFRSYGRASIVRTKVEWRTLYGPRRAIVGKSICTMTDRQH
jgi:hypothetical protein